MKPFLSINVLIATICIGVIAPIHGGSASDLKNRTPQLQKRLASPEPKLPIPEKQSDKEAPRVEGRFEIEAQLLYDYLRGTAGLTDEAAVEMLRAGDIPADKIVRY